MTSKEMLDHIKCELALSQAKAQIIMGLPNKEEMEINKICFQQIKQDLEILDMLKPFVKAVIELKGQNINVLDFHISDSAKTKIKEWLDK